MTSSSPPVAETEPVAWRVRNVDPALRSSNDGGWLVIVADDRNANMIRTCGRFECEPLVPASALIALQSETVELRAALGRIIEADTQTWRVDHADGVLDTVRIETRDGPLGSIARASLSLKGE